MADEENPATGTIYYYRRYCDDYSQYQFYKADEVSANYTDMKAGIRNPFVSEEERELVLVETEQGFLAEQLYLYLPQAVGFVIARLLGLGMYGLLWILTPLFPSPPVALVALIAMGGGAYTLASGLYYSLSHPDMAKSLIRKFTRR